MPLLRNAAHPSPRQVSVTAALCQERLLSVHVEQALALTRLTGEHLDCDEALDIYIRLLRLSEEVGRNIGSRVYAELGRSAPGGEVEPAAGLAGPIFPEEAGPPRGRFFRMRRRIQGRVQAELRMQIELAAARARDALLEAHVANCLFFAREFRDWLSVPRAVTLYLKTMGMSEAVSGILYDRALRFIADQALPPVPHAEETLPAEQLAAKVLRPRPEAVPA